MSKSLRIVLAQLNLTVGDLSGNLKKHIDAAIKARDELNADVIVFPELGLSGYSPEDLLLRPGFIKAAQTTLEQFIAAVSGIYCVVGFPQESAQGLQNCCALVYNGKIIAHYAKQQLPNYGVFDERRYFTPGDKSCVVDIKGIPTGLVICEDIWKIAPAKDAANAGAKLLLVPNASPYEINKHEQRTTMLTHRAARNNLTIAYVNNIGGQDDLVFDGGSMIFDRHGKLCRLANFFTEELVCVDVTETNGELEVAASTITTPDKLEQIYSALVLSVRDYINKNNFPGVIVGASGGIDSALTLAIAVDAIGKDRVRAIMMPSRYSADISLTDAQALTSALGIHAENISIEPTYKAFIESLAPSFANTKPDVTEENLQARCRGVILMAISNKTGYMVLTTGNRSEIATGYCTLYGDMVGGFAVLKDVPKMLVYALANYRNQISPVIPQRTIDRAPSAELAPDQKDQDSLPPYPILDKILEYYLNESQNIDEIVAQGFERDTVARVIQLLHRSEYKRRQSVMGPRINNKSFGRDWRYPLTNKFSE